MSRFKKRLDGHWGRIGKDGDPPLSRSWKGGEILGTLRTFEGGLGKRGRDWRIIAFLGEGSRVAREGRDITLFGYNISVLWCERAAEILSAEHGIEAEVIDLYALAPLDREGIAASVTKTHRALVAEEAEAPVGVGSEVMAILNEECFYELDAPPIRVSALNVPVPYNSKLEAAAIPDHHDIVTAVLRLFGRQG